MTNDKIVVQFIDSSNTGARQRKLEFNDVKEANTWIETAKAFDKFIHDAKLTFAVKI